LLLIGPVILEDCMTGQSYPQFLRNELPEQLKDIPLATWIAMYFQHDISMTLSLIGGLVMAVPLTGHQVLQT
jgi:hypothetical protein